MKSSIANLLGKAAAVVVTLLVLSILVGALVLLAKAIWGAIL